MIIKLKKKHSKGFLKVAGKVDVKEVVIHEEIMHPEKESINIMYRGPDASGIIELTAKETDMLIKKIKPATHLIKDMKVFTNGSNSNKPKPAKKKAVKKKAVKKKSSKKRK